MNEPTILEPSYLLEEIPCDCTLCHAIAAIEDRHTDADAEDETAREIVASGCF